VEITAHDLKYQQFAAMLDRLAQHYRLGHVPNTEALQDMCSRLWTSHKYNGELGRAHVEQFVLQFIADAQHHYGLTRAQFLPIGASDAEAAARFARLWLLLDQQELELTRFGGQFRYAASRIDFKFNRSSNSIGLT
jgi:hypothetical protein